MSQQNQPIAFEIEIKPKNSPKSNPLIKQKLENMGSYHDAAPSLQEIHDKLERAEKARKLEFEKRKGRCDESFAKLHQNREA